MKKQIISILILKSIMLSSVANSIENKDVQICQSNVLHYSASINDLSYFSDLLNLNTFTLTDLNKNCDTVYHIAIQNNNKNILENLFNYIDIKDIYNKKGENLIQYSIKHNQPEILIYLINKGLSPIEVSKNKKNGFDYQEKYGNLVTEKILKNYERTQLLMLTSNEKETHYNILIKLKKKLEEKENLMNSNDSNINLSSQQNLKQEILLLTNQIEFLSNIINQKNMEIKNLRNALKNSGIDSKKITPKFKEEDFSKKIKDISSNKGTLIDINHDEIEKESNLIFNLLSKPIYKLEKD